MARFKVGDRALFVGSRLHPEWIGEVVKVVAAGLGEGFSKKADYAIEFDRVPTPDGYYAWAADEWQLAPIIDPGSWEAIESATGWQPERERA